MSAVRFPGTPLIVLGMGRSGTSFLAGFLNSIGVHLGSELIPASAANPRGFFEDREIVAFHQELLKKLQDTHGWDDPARPLVMQPELSEEDREHASVILDRLAKPGFWGWKDPRTVHYIEFWLRLLPGAKLIVPLRHPLELLYSYLKRVANIEHWSDIGRILTAYGEYHERIYSVVEQHRANSLVIYTQNAFLRLDGLRDLLTDFLKISVDRRDLPRISFEPSEFTRLTVNPDAVGLCHLLDSRAAAAFDRLNGLASFPFVPDLAMPPSRAMALRSVAELYRKEDSPTKESCMPMLIDLCKPDACPGYFALQGRTLAGHSELERFWKTQADFLQRELKSHAAVIAEQVEWIRELRAAKEFAEGQSATQLKELTSATALIQEQAVWIELLKAKGRAEGTAAVVQP